MIRSRLRKIAVVAGAGTVAAVTTLALNPISASATGPLIVTTTTLTQPTVSTGHAATFVASLSPYKTPAPGPVTRATGPITFTITGSDASTVSCTGSNAAVITKKGKALCTVVAGSLLASASPYTVTASYGGDDTFASSSATVSETIGRTPTKITLSDGGTPPASASGSVFTATVTSGSASLPTGTVTFLVTATDGIARKANCKPDLQPLSPSASTPPVAQATCTLAAGWLKVAKTTKGDPNPTTSWAVTAHYGGDSTFAPNSTTMRGKA